MRELSLFTGAGGGLLGTHLLGWRPIGYVEFNDYCQRVIAQRIADGILPEAPIFGDVRQFVQSGAAAQYRGFADVVTGGFPCQPFSVAGKRRGADDERNMWPATAECVRIVRPRYCFFENVPGLLNSGYFGRIVADLAACGYGVRWRVLSAAELGAPHRRDRLWIVAHAQRTQDHAERRPHQCGRDTMGWGAETAQRTDGQAGTDSVGRCGTLAHAHCTQHDGGQEGTGWRDGWLSDAASSGRQCGRVQRNEWWETEPSVGRVVDGLASRVDRLKALGNGQVPLCAALAFLLLAGGES